MNRILAAGAGLLFCSVVAVAQPTSVPGDAEIRRILTERIDEEHRSVGIVVGVVEPGGRRVVGYGRLATDDDRRPDGDTVFEIGSITKGFTSIVLADMVQRGEVALDDPVQRLLPADVRVPTRNGTAITLLHLATHSSGLPRLPDNLDPADPANPYADYTVAQLYAFLSSHELGRDIGEAVEYSNLGVGLLGHALATRADSDYETLVRDRVLGPLAMLDTSITLTPAGRDRLATGHDRALDPVANWDIPTFAGAGALRSTVNDMLMFIEANLGVRQSPLRAAIEATHRSQRSFGPPNMDIGLGWLLRTQHGRTIAWHNGGTGGYRSFLGFDAASGTGVVVLSNAARSPDDLGFHLLDQRFELVEAPQQRTEVGVGPAIYDDYGGRYQLAMNVIITVTREDDQLFVQLTGQQRIEVFPESATDFFMRVVDAQITFGRDDSGVVDHLVMHQNGADQRAVRLGEGVESVEYGSAEIVSLPEATMERYVGRYELQPGFVIAITRQGSQLSAQVTGQPSVEIYASSETEFFYRVVDARITFQVGGDGTVAALTLHQGGRDLPGRKLP